MSDEDTEDRLDEDAVLAESDDFAAALGQVPTEPQDEEPAEEHEDPSEAPPASGDGPSAEMLAVGKVAGVPQQLLDGAKDNDAVSALIDWIKSSQTPDKPDEKPAAEPEPDTLENILGEEFDEDDVLHRQVKHMLERANAALAADRRAINLLLQHANSQIQQEKQSEAASFQQPYDLAIDQLDEAVFGNSAKGLTDQQIKMRAAVFPHYADMIDGEPAERHAEIAQNLFKAKYGSHSTRERKREQQSMRRLGGRASASRPEPLEDLDAFEQALAAFAQK